MQLLKYPGNLMSSGSTPGSSVAALASLRADRLAIRIQLAIPSLPPVPHRPRRARRVATSIRARYSGVGGFHPSC